MLENLAIEQPKLHKLFSQELKKNSFSHAYLLEVATYDQLEPTLNTINAILLCENIQNSEHNIDNCNICSMIRSNNYPNIKIIETSANQIKKEEITNLQEAFKIKPILGKRMVYVIKEAEKMNKATSNSILKFLEEPAPGVTAILITSNRFKLLDTILSRCQIISLISSAPTAISTIDKLIAIYNEDTENISHNTNEKIAQDIKNIHKFITELATYKTDMLLNSHKYFLQYYKERSEVLNIFKIIKIFLIDMLKYKLNEQLLYFNDELDLIASASATCSLGGISRLILLIDEGRERLLANANVHMVIDYLVLKYGGLYDKSS